MSESEIEWLDGDDTNASWWGKELNALAREYKIRGFYEGGFLWSRAKDDGIVNIRHGADNSWWALAVSPEEFNAWLSCKRLGGLNG